MPSELKVTVECPNCKKRFECNDVYSDIVCPHCSAEIAPLPNGESCSFEPDKRDLV